MIDCIAFHHDLRLVALAVLVCAIGSTATMLLFGRVLAARGRSRFGWIALAAVGTGTMVWCTHFVAMLAFKAGVPVTLNPVVTFASLAVAILLAAPGLVIATTGRRGRALAGGAVVGVAISAMHYTGMSAYRVGGMVAWRWPWVIASVLLSSGLAAAAFRTCRGPGRPRQLGGSLLLGAAVSALHFTGMAAMRIDGMGSRGGDGLSSETMTALAIATACASLLFIGCAAVSALIDGQTRSDAFLRLRRMALHDGLTDLPNRMSFHEELASRLHRSGGTRFLAVAMLDLSRFKAVNDTYGHQAGDQLLVALAARMKGVLGAGECIARLGGDEFAALVSFDDRSELDRFLAGLAGLFAYPFAFHRFSASIGANIGVAVAPGDGRDADSLLARADLAMYRAKSERSAVPCFYDAAMDDAVRDRRELAADLRGAVARGAFELHYQVQASALSGEVSGYEALIRWHHPTRGLVPPGLFIPLAEEIGEIIPLSNWVLRRACREAAAWPNRDIVSVNLSALHLSEPGLVDTVRHALTESGLSPERLTLELTESAIIRDRAYALDQLTALKAMGVSLALDDFGVGYSSLDVLRAFSFDRIKLDGSFVAEIDKDDHAVAILRSVVALGTTLDIPVLAEGIEEPAQLHIARREGCSAVQGYLIGRPSRELVNPLLVRNAVRGLPDPETSLVA